MNAFEVNSPVNIKLLFSDPPVKRTVAISMIRMKTSGQISLSFLGGGAGFGLRFMASETGVQIGDPIPGSVINSDPVGAVDAKQSGDVSVISGFRWCAGQGEGRGGGTIVGPTVIIEGFRTSIVSTDGNG